MMERRFPVAEIVDVRMGTTFLLEACFELDTKRGAASLRSDCSSGLYAESQVVSLGSHRYFRDVTSYETGVSTTTQQIFIDHSGVTCIVSDFHPMLLAGIDPTEFVTVGRVFFRAPPNPDFYYVDMRSSGTGFEAVLPRPAPETREFVYYIEAIDTSAEPVQTPEFTVRVDDCEEAPDAAYYQGENPGIVVGSAVPGADLTPPGFLSVGIMSFHFVHGRGHSHRCRRRRRPPVRVGSVPSASYSSSAPPAASRPRWSSARRAKTKAARSTSRLLKNVCSLRSVKLGGSPAACRPTTS